MPTLHWIGKDKVINHHQDVPFRILEKQYTYSNGEETSDGVSENKIIHGDNLEALKSLLPEYEGKIKCIYIDPPYNTGNEGWVYNDNVNDPKIKKWLGQVVGRESEDLSRHDKWLCMMYPRLKLLHKLLAEDGAIFISIDDNEQANLKLVCDEIFGSINSIGPIIQNKMNAKNDTVNIQKNHEFILVYRKQINFINGSRILPTLTNLDLIEKQVFEEKGKYYYINDAITTRGEGGVLNARPNLGYTVYYNSVSKEKIAVKDYDIELAKTSNDPDLVYGLDKELISKGFNTLIRPPKVRGKLGCWTWSLEKFNEDNDQIIITGKNNQYTVKKRTFVKEEDVIEDNGKFKIRYTSETNSRSILDFSTNDGTNVLNNIMGEQKVFDTPKNINLISYLIKLINDDNITVLDSFAGSGTTAHAVLNLNKQDGGNRKFILIEMEDYAEDITAERVKRVIKGYGADNKTVEGTGGSFSYYKLDKPVFLNNEMLNEQIGRDKIEEYVWYSETKLPHTTQQEKYLLGIKDQTAYYFYYEKDKMTTLDESFLRKLKTRASQYIIYADNCLLNKELMQKYNIIFKKIPRDITRF